jgi:hypothetical protein
MWLLRKLSGFKKNEVTGDWRRLRTDENHYLYWSRSIFFLARQSPVGQDLLIHEVSKSHIWLEKVNERGHMEELGTDVRMILKCTSSK